MVKYFCDVCNKEIEDTKEVYEVKVSGIRAIPLKYDMYYMEICPECAKSVYDLLQNRKAGLK